MKEKIARKRFQYLSAGFRSSGLCFIIFGYPKTKSTYSADSGYGSHHVILHNNG